MYEVTTGLNRKGSPIIVILNQKISKKMNITELQDMRLHTEAKIRKDVYVLRVPGGWIYTYYLTTGIDGNTDNLAASSVFVPYSDNI
ncbi:MAG: hypothetical protein KDC34_19120 [Saprospiraceae bacterium]|nr:hypothetical protein [Saprospiraceae bacterium]